MYPRIKSFLKQNAPNRLLAPLAALKILWELKFYKVSRSLGNANRKVIDGKGQAAIPISLFEHHALSEYGEAGIIDGILQIIGRKTGKIIEFGFHPTQANCMNEALFQRANALFIDASSSNPEIASSAFKILARPNVKAISSFVTIENVNELFRKNGFFGEIDVLSIDIDSNDYWIWKAIEVVSPRVVIMEYNDRLGPELAITIKYDANFVPMNESRGFYEGASLAALEKLGKAKGYRLIGCESAGVNAFFLRDHINTPAFPTVRVAEAFRYHKRSQTSGMTDQQRHQFIATLPFESV